MPPEPEKLFGHNGFRFMIGNLFWYYIISQHVISQNTQSLFLQETGELRILNAAWGEDEVYENIRKLFNTRKIK